jgi:hypothetical protein
MLNNYKPICRCIDDKGSGPPGCLSSLGPKGGGGGDGGRPNIHI